MLSLCVDTIFLSYVIGWQQERECLCAVGAHARVYCVRTGKKSESEGNFILPPKKSIGVTVYENMSDINNLNFHRPANLKSQIRHLFQVFVIVCFQ